MSHVTRSPDIHIFERPMVAADVAAVAAIHADSWRTAYRGMLSDAYLDGNIDRDRLAAWSARGADIESERTVARVIEHGAVMLGFAYVIREADPVFGDLLDNLHVRSNERGCGYGRMLLHGVAAELSRHGSRGLYLWVYAANHRARRFYEREGARQVDEAMHEGADGSRVPAVRYAWADLRRFEVALLLKRRSLSQNVPGAEGC